MSHPRAPGSPPTPKIAIIGGSGLGDTFGGEGHASHDIETPFGRPSGPILETAFGGVPVLLLGRHGPGHVLNPSQVPYRANLFALKQLGATHVLASGAVGSLREEFRPRDLVIPDGAIDKTIGRSRTFFERAAVHVEFADPFCPVLRTVLTEAAGGLDGVTVHGHGCYVCMEGPAFSTRAESHMHRLWGGDLIGMTLLPEARLAKEAELPYAAVCLVTDYDCWRPHKQGAGEAVDPLALLQEIIGHLKQATVNAAALLQQAVPLMAERATELALCPSRRALELAIWSDKARIDPAEVDRLRPLWGKYFETKAGPASGAEAAAVSPATVNPAAVD